MNASGGKRRSRRLITFLCFLIIVAEGYDMIAYSTVLPVLLKTHAWGITTSSAGFIGSATLIGLLVGSLTAGALADRWGRKPTIILGTAWFSVWTTLCAVPAGLVLFGTARFLVGLGIGTIVASAGALAVECAPRGKSQTASALTWIGAAVGALLGVVLGLVLLPRFGPAVMFLVGAVPLVALVPALVVFLPESPAHLIAKGRADEAAAVVEQYGFTETPPAATEFGSEKERLGIPGLFLRSRRSATVALGVLSALILLVLYGVSTWLPVLMQGEGHSPSTALVFLLVLSAGGAVVPLYTGRLADRRGPRLVTASVLAAAAVSMFLLTTSLPLPVLLALSFVVGGGTSGGQVLLYGWAAAFYPTSCRAAGVAWIAGVGRLGAIAGPVVTGLVLAGGNGPGTTLVVFAGIAVLAVGCALLVRKKTAHEAVAADAVVLAGTEPS